MFYNYIHTRRGGVQLVGVEIEKLPYIERDNIINTPPLICLCIYIYIYYVAYYLNPRVIKTTLETV